jgi:predicted Zn-dependent peptidase
MTAVTKISLAHDIPLFYKQNISTPRTAINVFINGGNCAESKPGLADLVGRLLTKGTTNRSSQQISQELDEQAIGLSVDVRQDFIRIGVLFLNEDLDQAIDILFDILQHPTFEQLERERELFRGELELELDSPRARAADNLKKAMYPDHPYGLVASKILEHLDSLTLLDAQQFYQSIFTPRNLSIFVVGEPDQQIIRQKIEAELQPLQDQPENTETILGLPRLGHNKIVTLTKEDAAQAQVLRGWYMPAITHQDFVALILVNNILGGFGLSSRLFLELRDKRGLAYSVSSSLESLRYGGNFVIYIGTEPKNIPTAWAGIDDEIQKIINEPVPEQELLDAKRNILGKREIVQETNMQQCYLYGLYQMMGVGVEFDPVYRRLIKAVTSADIARVAQTYLTQPSVTSILAPAQFLTGL